MCIYIERRDLLLAAGGGLGFFSSGCTDRANSDNNSESDSGSGSTTNSEESGSGDGNEPADYYQGDTLADPDSTRQKHGRTLIVQIEYPGHWSGAISHRGTELVEGSGFQEFGIDESGYYEADAITIRIEKQDDSSDQLTVQLLENGETIVEDSTRSPHGMVEIYTSVD